MFGRETLSSIRRAADAATVTAETLRTQAETLPESATRGLNPYLDALEDTATDTLLEWKSAAQAVSLSAYIIAAGIALMCGTVIVLAIRDRAL